MMRASTETERAALKTAARVLVHRAGGLEAAAMVTRLNKSALAESYDPHRADRFLPVDAVADLERVGGAPAVTQALAQAAGCVLVPVQLAPGPEAQAIAAVLRGAGEIGAAWALAMSDADLSAEERQGVVQRLAQLQAACMQALAALMPEHQAKGEAG